jgi:hypothetical protein
LITYPCGKEDVSYIIIDDTIRIASYALENVTSLEEITFPSSLSSIGNGAFLGANALRLITSNAVQSPTLESLYDENNNQNYDNFITHINNGATSITLYIPKNGIGYDSLVYRSYFNEEKIITQNINMPDMNVIYFIHELNKYDDNALLTKTQKDTLYDLYISIPKNMLSFISDEQLAFYQSLIK